MTGRVEGKVAFITGAARGQGRAHAVRLAEEGADIIASDACIAKLSTIPYELGSEADLAETRRLVEATGRRIVTGVADVRDQAALDRVVAEGVAEFGRLDIVLRQCGRDVDREVVGVLGRSMARDDRHQFERGLADHQGSHS